jgi:transposase
VPGPHRAPYPPEPRAEAVQPVQAGDVPPAPVARDPGVNAETLRLWVRRADLDAGRGVIVSP